jgi:dTDP-4-amino-4,6-dideoxygalactose transaminase
MSDKIIPFNKPFIVGKELEYIADVIQSRKFSGNGKYTNLCHNYFEKKIGTRKALMTTSCTDALEMSAILIDIKEGDEVIVPSYTFVSTANAFILRGARIIFADSESITPNIDTDRIEMLITKKTKAIVPVHYAGIACNMEIIQDIANRHNLFVIEDAAQAIDSYYKTKALCSLGNLGCFSFHDTKNIISGEGGLLAVNDEKYLKRAEIVWEKGTNRAEYIRGEVNKYNWVDVGSSFLPAEIVSAFLYAQIEQLEEIQAKRKEIWQTYYNELKPLEETEKVRLPFIPDYATNNAHSFFMICRNLSERDNLIYYLKSFGIHSAFHYLALHKSPYFSSRYPDKSLPNAEMYSDRLIRLPLFYELDKTSIEKIIYYINKYYQSL